MPMSWKLIEGSMYVEGNICDIVFDKAKCRGEKVKRMSYYVEATVQQGSSKKVL